MSRPNHREALLKAAKRLLREQGYARITARDLVGASGTNLASIGYHFGSKEALLNEAIGESFGEWTQRVTSAAMVDADAEPLERVMSGWRAMLGDFGAVRPMFVAFIEALAQAERSTELRAQLAAQYDEFRREVSAAVSEVIGGEDADVIASFLIAVCDGLLIQSFLDPSRTPDADELELALGRGLAAALSR